MERYISGLQKKKSLKKKEAWDKNYKNPIKVAWFLKSIAAQRSLLNEITHLSIKMILTLQRFRESASRSVKMQYCI